MAGASQKKIAASNKKILKEIHLISCSILAISAVAVFAFHRPASVKPFVIFNIPLLVCQAILESTGRPKYGPEGSKLSGTVADLRQEGLTEYMFDIIYFTGIEDILMILCGSNKVWWLYIAIPAFAIYKSFWLLKLGKNLLGIGKGKGAPMQEDNDVADEPTKSKRQAKMEARGQKGKRKVIR
ncbi:Snd2 protein [Saccharomycopsis crataegensis]|uniref:Snd2 protein n=1 Tax=Saccharomycopsis crataegensis TaxID=43959 RepID=A0AAV5QU70_9ASCO|nr:Snd2 protein [Saccharomycopsis crataegensis]